MGLKTGTKENFGQKYFQFQQFFSLFTFIDIHCVYRVVPSFLSQSLFLLRYLVQA